MKKLLFLLTLTFGLFITSCTDPCKDIECNSAGTCVEGVCACDNGYTGTNCETEIRTKFIGEWYSPNFVCDGDAPEEITFVIEANNLVTGILLYVKDTPDSKIPGIVNGNVITITDYLEPTFETIFNCTFTLNNEVLQMDFNLTDDGIPSICSGPFTKL